MSRFLPIVIALIFGAIFGAGQMGDIKGSILGDAPLGTPVAGKSADKSSINNSDDEDCQRVKDVVSVDLDASEYSESAAHIEGAIAAGAPSVLHIDRDGADANRALSLAGIPTKPGLDRDEYPLAMTSEGGAGASIQYMTPADNRGSGSSIAGQISDYCNGQAFTIEIE